MMDKFEAYRVIGLPEGAPRNEIEARYTRLVKKAHAENDTEAMNRISQAYDVLVDRVVLPEPENPAMQRVVFGKTLKTWAHLWEYNRIRILVTAVIAALVISLIVTIATNRDPDFKLGIIGDHYLVDQEAAAAYFYRLFPDLEAPAVETAYISRDGTGGYDAAGVQKALIMLSYGEEDLLVVDRRTFDQYKDTGVFVPLDDTFGRLASTLPASRLEALVPIRHALSEEGGGDGTERIYGIDATKTRVMLGLGLVMEPSILCVSIKSRDLPRSHDALVRLLEDADYLLDQIPTLFPSPTPDPAASPTPAASPIP